MQVETLFRAHHFTFEATICCSTLECGEPQLILTMAKVGVLTTTKYLPSTNTNLLSELFKTKFALEHTILTFMRLLDPHHKVSPVQHRAPKTGIISSTKMLPKA